MQTKLQSEQFCTQINLINLIYLPVPSSVCFHFVSFAKPDINSTFIRVVKFIRIGKTMKFYTVEPSVLKDRMDSRTQWVILLSLQKNLAHLKAVV